MTGVVLVFTTMPAESGAEDVATTLVSEHLAACVNIGPPMISIYRWKGQTERDSERQLVIKTTRDRVDALKARITALHPYELPEFLVVSVADGSQAYLDWVAEETRGGS